MDGDAESSKGTSLHSRFLIQKAGMANLAAKDFNDCNTEICETEEEFYEEDSEDEDLTAEDRELRKEIMRNFLA